MQLWMKWERDEQDFREGGRERNSELNPRVGGNMNPVVTVGSLVHDVRLCTMFEADRSRRKKKSRENFVN